MGKTVLTQRKGAGSVYTLHGHKRLGPARLRIRDYSERHGFVRGTVKTIEHEAGRGAPLARVEFRDPYKYKRVKELFIAPEGLFTGQSIVCGKNAPLAVGNVLPIGSVPEGCIVCNVEEKPGDRGALARASGDHCIVVSHKPELGYTYVKLPSGNTKNCLLYTSDAADEEDSVDLGGRRIIKKKKKRTNSLKYTMKSTKQIL
eukprot:TRINITY_DN616_c0_g1_i1.p1 TRINITY_DN616_c0_g1~~TRINITY_DN616_c0_g1_i1.p1  ORF type:complete len:202 (-),score=50.68 TRINITY_DN616_c0_g1_i1:39-644(-)